MSIGKVYSLPHRLVIGMCVALSRLHKFILAAAEDINLAAKDDCLDVYACLTNQKLGRLDVSIDLTSTIEDGYIVVVTAKCNGKIDGLDCGTRLKTHILLTTFATLTQSHEEYLQIDDDINFSKNSYIDLIDDEYHVHVETTTSSESANNANVSDANRKTFDTIYPRDALPAFLSEGALILVQKLLVTKRVIDRFNCIGLDGEGKLCPIQLTSPNLFQPNNNDLFGDSVNVVALEKVIPGITGGREESWSLSYCESGHLCSWEHLSSPIFMKVPAVPDGAIDNADSLYDRKLSMDESNNDDDAFDVVNESLEKSNHPVVDEMKHANERSTCADRCEVDIESEHVDDIVFHDDTLTGQLPQMMQDTMTISVGLIDDQLGSAANRVRRISMDGSLGRLVNQAESIISKAVDTVEKYSNVSAVAPPLELCLNPAVIEKIRDSARYLSSMNQIQIEIERISNDENVKKTYETAMTAFLQSATQMFDVLFSNGQTKPVNAGIISGQLQNIGNRYPDMSDAERRNKCTNTPEEQGEKITELEYNEKESKVAVWSISEIPIVDMSYNTLLRADDKAVQDNLVVEEIRAFVDKYAVAINELYGQKQAKKDTEDIKKSDENNLALPTVNQGSKPSFGDIFKPSETIAIKDKLKSEYTTYLSEHTELKPLMKKFVKELLIRKPDSVYKFAAAYFTDKYESSPAVRQDFNCVTLVIEYVIDPEVVHDFTKYELIYDKLWNEALKLGKLTSLIVPLQNRSNFNFGKETKLTYEVGNAYLTYKTANETNDALAYFEEKYDDQDRISVRLVIIENP